MTATDAPMLDDVLSVYADSLIWIRQTVEDIPPELMTAQPGGMVNHPAWTLSHLSTTAAFLGGLLGENFGAVFPTEKPLYGNGSKPVADLGAYGSKEDLIVRLSDRHTWVEEAVRAKHASHFPRPTPEHLRAFAPTLGRLAVYVLTAHENYHLAQLVLWRRAAGLG